MAALQLWAQQRPAIDGGYDLKEDDAMAKSWDTVDHGRGQKTIFNLAGIVIETGAAGTRCFHDLRRQRGDDAALEAVGRAYRFHGSEFPHSQGAATFDVNVERMLLGAGIPKGRVPELARLYREDRRSNVNLSAGAE